MNSYTINDQEYTAILDLTAEDRFKHFIKRVADCEVIWTLRTTDGFVLSGDDAKHELVPVWPHPRYATACATGLWQGAEPVSIPLEEWIEKWVPGMERDGRRIAIFPTPNDQSIVAEPSTIAEALDQELEMYE